MQWGAGSGQANLLAAEIVGVLFILAWSGFHAILIFSALNHFKMLRVDPEQEEEGLDVTHHGGECNARARGLERGNAGNASILSCDPRDWLGPAPKRSAKHDACEANLPSPPPLFLAPLALSQYPLTLINTFVSHRAGPAYSRDGDSLRKDAQSINGNSFRTSELEISQGKPVRASAIDAQS